MSATQIGTLTNGKLNRTFGDEITFLADGGANAIVHYYCTWSLSLLLIPVKYSPHPDFPWLLLTNWKNERSEGDVALIQCTYVGAQSTAQLPEPESQFEVVTSTEPIESHPLYKDTVTLDDKSKIRRKLSATTQQEYDDIVLTGDALALFTKKMNGTTSYLVPTITYSRTYASYSRPQSIDKVGLIDKPPQAPGLETGRNWLKTGHVWDRAGGYYRVRESWRASGPGGVDTDLYK